MNRENVKTTSTPDEDSTLARAATKGDKHAFDRLVITYRNRVFNLCYRYMGDYDDADDTAQETFVKAYKSLGSFRHDAAFSTWLFRIAVNTCKNKQQSLAYRIRKKMLRITGAKSNDENEGIDIADDSRSPQTVSERREVRDAIMNAIAALPDEQKTVVILRDIEKLPYEEIGSILNTAPGTVKSRLARGRTKLKEKLKNLV